MKSAGHISKQIRIVACIALVAFAAISLVGCGQAATKNASITKSTTYSTLESFDIPNKTVGVETGAIYGPELEARYPGVDAQYYNSSPDLVQALLSGKVDAIVGDSPIINVAMQNTSTGLSYVGEEFMRTDSGLVFGKSDRGMYLQEEFNAFLADLQQSGELTTLKAKWFSSSLNDTSIPDVGKLSADKGTIVLAAQSTEVPFAYIDDNEFKGYEIELVLMFCQLHGYGLEIMNTDFTGLLSAVESGKADIGASGISITEERKKSVLFSDVTYTYLTLLYVQQDEKDVAPSQSGITTLADLDGKRVGTLVGSSLVEMTAKLAGSTGKMLTYNSIADLAIALESGKIDAYIYDEPEALYMCATRDDCEVLEESVAPLQLAMVLRKDDERAQVICSELNAYIAKLKASGELEALKYKWMEQADASKQVVDFSNIVATKGKLSLATVSSVGAPIAYVKDGHFAGYDIDIFVGFCREYGYEPKIVDMDLSGLLAAIQSGKYDVGACGLTITEERAQSVLFTDPIFEGGHLCVVKKQSSQTTEGFGAFFKGIAESFKKTFVDEGRWQLFIGGIGNTLLITVLSLVLGTLLGFGIVLWCRNGGRVRNRIVDFAIWLIQGMPVVVFLMILFYIVFGSVSISGVVVSVIGFTLIFATSVIGLLRMGISAVDEGQEEAAQTLGYSRTRAFFRIVLPQAVRHVLSAYQSEMVTLLKGTAIVGYIAVQDLTKVGDIIRSRTYEAFFPLIAVAVIYFILAALLKALINVVAKKTDPSERTPREILKGIEPEGDDV